MTRIGNLQNYVLTSEQMKARINAQVEKQMAESGATARFDALRKMVAEQPKLDKFTSQLKTANVKPSIGSRILQKFVNLFKFVK